MDLTYSYKTALPTHLIDKYNFLETRNAAAVLKASNPAHFDDLIKVLEEFQLYDADLLIPGGNRGQVPTRLDKHFEKLGWRAVRVNTEFKLVGKMKASLSSSSFDVEFLESTVKNPGFEVDNMKDRVAIDVEWNAKDGNLDRDLAAYRSFYELGLVDAAALITRDHEGIRQLAGEDLQSTDAYRRLGTTTTTNMTKLQDRMTRGDSGGCPLFAVGITRKTWAGRGVPRPGEEHTTVEELLEAYKKAQASKGRTPGAKAELSDEEIDQLIESVEDEHSQLD